MLRGIPCTLMRGGTSKGLYFHAPDLPADRAARDRVLLAAMGSPDPRQIDGVGGAHPLTSKVAVIAAVDPARRRRRLPVPAGRRGPCRGQRQPELRQYSRRDRSLGDRERTRSRARSGDPRPHPHAEHREHRGRARAHSGRAGRVRRRDTDRWRAGHGGGDSDRLCRRRGLELRRVVADGLHRRSGGRPRDHLYRQRHARRAAEGERPRQVGLRGARRPRSRRGSEGASRADTSRHRPTDEPGRRHPQDGAEDVPGGTAARRRRDLHADLHPAPGTRLDRRPGRRQRRDRLRAAGLGRGAGRRCFHRRVNPPARCRASDGLLHRRDRCRDRRIVDRGAPLGAAAHRAQADARRGVRPGPRFGATA